MLLLSLTYSIQLFHKWCKPHPFSTAHLVCCPHRLKRTFFPLRNRYSTTYGFDADFAWENAKASTPQERVDATQAYLDLGLMHRVTLNTFVSATSDALAADPPDWASFDAAWGR